MVKNCQMCGNPMFSRNDMGREHDGTINKDYCSGCYKDGEFAENHKERNFVSSAYPFALTSGLSVYGNMGSTSGLSGSTAIPLGNVIENNQNNRPLGD